MNKQLQALLARRAAVVQSMQALTDAASTRADGAFTDAERASFEAAQTDLTKVDADITLVKAAIEATRTGTSVAIPGNAAIEMTDNLRDSPTHGFRSFGEFAVACIQASGGDVDARLQRGLDVQGASTAPSSYGNTSTGADGGFLVPPEFSQNVVQTAYNQTDSFLPMTDNTPVTGNGMTFPVDETTPWGSAGVKAYWTDEAGASTETKTKLDPAQLRLKKLTALVPLSEELLSDAAAIGAYVQGKVPQAINFKTNEALWAGSGAGRPRGFSKAAGLLITVTKETSQAAGTILAMNLSKMRARMSAQSYRRAIWQINADCLPQLDSLVYATAATNGVAYNPVGGRFGYGTILGRDVMVTDFNESIGTAGDIALVDWGMYRTITKAGGGMETATSMHFWFDRGLTAFRTTFRIDGQPAITAPVTPNKGSASQGPIVMLEAR